MGGRPSFGMTLKKCYLDLYVLALYKDTWVLWKEGGALVTGCLDLQGGSFCCLSLYYLGRFVRINWCGGR